MSSQLRADAAVAAAAGMPDGKGRFGAFGGRYVPETLIPALDALTEAYAAAMRDPAFTTALDDALRNYAGRPSPLSDAPRFSERIGTQV